MRCRGGGSQSRRCTGVRDRLSLKWQTPKVCHCEEAAGRRGALSAKREEVPLGCNLAVPGCIVGKLPAKSQLPSRDCHVASLLAMTRQGSAAMGTVRHTESAVLLPLRGRAWLSPPLQGQYGLNGGWYKSVSAFPRLPRPLWGLAMTRQGSAAMGTVRRIESAVLLPLRGRAWLSPPLQGQCGLNDGRRMIHSSVFRIHYSLTPFIPLWGMANHMTKRPEIPCLSCKFPQSRRICH